MLAALDRSEPVECPGHLSRLPSQVPHSSFKAAYRELCARLWIELELLAQCAFGADRRGPAREVTLTAATLRLELIVLVDSCRCARWRCMLSLEQSNSLCSMLTDVLAALHVESEHLNAAIAEAQDRVLDELPPESADRPSPLDPVSACKTWQGANPAIHELLGLIEARAAARRASAAPPELNRPSAAARATA